MLYTYIDNHPIIQDKYINKYLCINICNFKYPNTGLDKDMAKYINIYISISNYPITKGVYKSLLL